MSGSKDHTLSPDSIQVDPPNDSNPVQKAQKAQRRHFTINAGNLQHLDKSIPNVEIPKSDLRIPLISNDNLVRIRSNSTSISRSEDSIPSFRPKKKRGSALEQRRKTLSNNVRSFLADSSPRVKKRKSEGNSSNGSPHIPKLDTKSAQERHNNSHSPRSFSVRLTSTPKAWKGTSKESIKTSPSETSTSYKRKTKAELSKSSSLKNLFQKETEKNTENKIKNEQIHNIADIPKDTLSQFIFNDPTSFMKLVDEEYKRASIMYSTPALSTRGMSEEDKKLLDQLHQIQSQHNSNPKKEKFKQRYTIKNTDVKNTEETLKISPVLNELIETEKSYLEKIKIVHQLFLRPIREEKILNIFETVTLFSNIESIVELNEDFLSDLETAILLPKENEKIEATYAQWIGEIFLYHAPKFQPVYAIYCANQPTILSTIRKYSEENKIFANFIKLTCKKPECMRQDLNSLLISPLQRLCKYPLLIKELIKTTSNEIFGFDALQSAMEKIRSCVDEVNKKVTKVENLTKLTEIQLELSNGANFRALIVDPTREFLLKEYMIVNGKIRHVYLFNHLVLITKQTPVELKLRPNNDSIEFFIVHVLLMNFIKLEENEPDENTFLVHCNSEYLFKCRDKMQYKKWVRHIKRLTNSSFDYIPQEVELRRTIAPINKKKKTSKSAKFSFSSGRKDSPKSEKYDPPRKLASIAHSDENALDYKTLFTQLSDRHRRETLEHKDEIEKLKSTIVKLQEKNASLEEKLLSFESKT